MMQHQNEIDQPNVIAQNSEAQFSAPNQPAQQPATPAPSSSMKKTLPLVLGIFAFAILSGIGTGYGLHSVLGKKSSSIPTSSEITSQVPEGSVKAGDVFGSSAENFSDNAQGYLVRGGLDGEGSHRLLRPGGPTQTVYLTSSITDLDSFEGTEVKVWGETFAGQKAGWLMDIGRVEVLDTAAEAPFEE